MKCKFCDAQLPEGSIICPNCGGDNDDVQMPELAMDAAGKPELTEEAPARKKPKLWAIILAAVAGLALLAVLVIAILYGSGIDVFGPPKDTPYDVMQRDNYTIENAADAQKVADTVVAVAGDVELTNSELQVYYWQTVSDYINNYYYALSTMGLDITQPLNTQIYDEQTGLTWQQFFLDNAIQTWHRYTVLGLKAKEEGFVLEAEAQAYVDEIPADMEEMAVYYGYTDVSDMLAKDISPICNMDGYMRYIIANLTGMEYFESIFDTMYPTDAETEAYYAENEQQFALNGINKEDGGKYVDVRHVLLQPTETEKDENGSDVYDESGYPVFTEASWEACRQQAEALYNDWQTKDGTEDGFAKMAAENSTDTGSVSNGGLYTQVAAGDMVPAFDAWCFDDSRKTGDHGLVKTEYGYHIMYFVDSEEIWMSVAREEMLTKRAEEVIEKAMENWPMVVSYDKIALGESAE